MKGQLVSFAEANGLAVGFRQVTPDPKQITVTMHSEDVEISGGMPFSMNELHVNMYRSGDRSASLATIDHLFAELRHAVLKVDGVTFSERASSR